MQLAKRCRKLEKWHVTGQLLRQSYERNGFSFLPGASESRRWRLHETCLHYGAPLPTTVSRDDGPRRGVERDAFGVNGAAVLRAPRVIVAAFDFDGTLLPAPGTKKTATRLSDDEDSFADDFGGVACGAAAVPPRSPDAIESRAGDTNATGGAAADAVPQPKLRGHIMRHVVAECDPEATGVVVVKPVIFSNQNVLKGVIADHETLERKLIRAVSRFSVYCAPGDGRQGQNAGVVAEAGEQREAHAWGADRSAEQSAPVEILMDDLEIYLAVGRGDVGDTYRKPGTGMWDLFRDRNQSLLGSASPWLQLYGSAGTGVVSPAGPDAATSGLHVGGRAGQPVRLAPSADASQVGRRVTGFFVGDAAGRLFQDRSSSDKVFARTIGLHFLTPEEFFV
eukprot:gene176-65_t